MSGFTELPAVIQALLAGMFTWGSTALGAALVFVLVSPRRQTLDLMLGVTAGVMLAASFWGLLNPAIEMAKLPSGLRWLPAAAGFILGWTAIQWSDKLLPALPVIDTFREVALPGKAWHRTLALVIAVTLHNIPEGLGLGIAFAGVQYDQPGLKLHDALVLALALGLHNLPEGIVIAMPLLRLGYPPTKCFFYGQMSAMVDPFFAVVGAVSIGCFENMLPYGMGFAAGAMIYVVISEVIPESHLSGHPHYANAGFALGLLLMMGLEFGLGG